MPAHPKLPEDIWADARAKWENDPRDGYAWLVADMALHVTGAAVRNRAMKEGWRKKDARSGASNPRLCCSCCGNHAHPEKTKGCCGDVSHSEILDRLARALEVVEDCATAIRETMPPRNHQ